MAAFSQMTVVSQHADKVWKAIRRFDQCEWAGPMRDVRIENATPPDAAGAIRSFTVGDMLLRERLLDHSDADRSYTYTWCERLPMENFRATLRVAPVLPTVPWIG